MSKSIVAAAQARLDGANPRMATAWIIVLKNGQVLRFTSHDKNKTFDGQVDEAMNPLTTPTGIAVDGTYLAAGGYRAGALQQGSDGRVDNMQIVARLDASAITERDLQGGLYNGAEVFLFNYFWDDTSIPVIPITRGYFGEFSARRGEAVIEFRELQAALHQRTGRVVMAPCDADLGDARCKVNLAALTVAGSVSSSADRSHFVGSTSGAADYFRFGVVTWTSGDNTGLQMEVKSHSGTSFELFAAMPYKIKSGDNYTVSPGCDKSLETCRDTFDNVPNHQGEPDVPGADAQLNPPEDEVSA